MRYFRTLVERIQAWRLARSWDRILAEWNSRHYEGDDCGALWCCDECATFESDVPDASRMAGDDRDLPADLADEPLVLVSLSDLLTSKGYIKPLSFDAVVATTEGSLLTDPEWAVAQHV